MNNTNKNSETGRRFGETLYTLPPRKQNALREEAKERYRNPDNIAAKWIDQYGNVSKDNDYQRNRACVTEVFNMLDVVMDICIADFRKEHCIVGIDIGRDKRPIYSYAVDEDETVTFSIPVTFARRVRVLRLLGYDLSDEVSDETRLLRNETTHGNQTIVLQHMSLGYEETMHAMLSMADALIALGKLDASLRVPTFDMLRVKEGDSLLGGAYTVEELLGEGGMSRVYRVVQNRGGRKMALKELKPGTYSEEKIRGECDNLARMRHPRIPHVYDFFSENGTYYIVMTLIEGEVLDQYWTARHADIESLRSSEAEAARTKIIEQLCDVLEYLHSDKISMVYVDLAPDNIMVSREGNIYLIDYGNSVLTNGIQSVPAVTLGYSAPEVFAGRKLDERTDIYSLGYILWFLYTGLTPYEYPENDTGSRKAVSGYLADSDKRIADAIVRCTERNPQDRYGSVQELKADLFPDANMSDNEISRRRRVNALIGTLLAACLAALVINIWRGQSVKESLSAEGMTASTSVTAGQLADAGFESSGIEDHVMEWGDERLEDEMRRITGIDSGDIMLSDVWNYTDLSLDNCGIQNVGALAQLQNLRYLSLMSNQITDVTALSGLTQLEYLNLQGNMVEDIEALASLQDLKELDLGNNRISDISVLSGLHSLTTLAVNDNPVSVEELKTMLEKLAESGSTKGIRSLNLCGLGITDCTWIADTVSADSLSELYLSDNALTDITPLASLSALSALYLSRNGVTDISAMASMPHLSEVDIQYNPVDDLSPLEEASELTWLDVKECSLTDLSPISNCTVVTSIDCSGNQISDLKPLEGLVRLSYLDAGSNALEGGVDPLRGLTALTYLDLSNNGITDISALSELTSIRYLYLEGNPVEEQLR